MRRSVPNWLIRSGCVDPFGLSNSNAGPAGFDDAIDDLGDLEVGVGLGRDTPELARVREVIQSRRSFGAVATRDQSRETSASSTAAARSRFAPAAPRSSSPSPSAARNARSVSAKCGSGSIPCAFSKRHPRRTGQRRCASRLARAPELRKSERPRKCQRVLNRQAEPEAFSGCSLPRRDHPHGAPPSQDFQDSWPRHATSPSARWPSSASCLNSAARWSSPSVRTCSA